MTPNPTVGYKPAIPFRKVMEEVSHEQMPEHEVAYYAAIRADKDWTAELERVFGNNACTARYEPRGKSTPKLARLYTAKRTADERLHKAWSALLEGVISFLIQVKGEE